MNTSCKKYSCLFLLLLCTFQAYSTSTYIEKYNKEVEVALNFYTTNKNRIKEIAGKINFSPAFLFAIVAPELTQYSYLSDKIETNSLKVFYVQGGKDYSNFSIGVFQMKPSFIEQMEDSMLINKELQLKYSDCLIDNPNSRKVRVERINRLVQLDWQLQYLALFCELVKQRFPAKQELQEAEMVAFYATAYNTGFHKSEHLIDNISKKSLFPHFSFTKYNYSEIALWFYQNCSKEAEKK